MTAKKTDPRTGHPPAATPRAPSPSAPTADVTSTTVGKIAPRRITFDELLVQSPTSLPTAAVAPKDLAVGERLVELGLISPLALDNALDEADSGVVSLTQVLLRDAADEDAVLRIFADVSKRPCLTQAKARSMKIPSEAIALVPSEVARELSLVPVSIRNQTEVLVASLTPERLAAFEDLRKKLRLRQIQAILTGPKTLLTAQNRFYDGIDADDPSTWIERDFGT
jgi:Type II secretion system (T2SS), protein E, N-terminal domain